jgi:putative heme-binding domain-containing protein
MRQTLQNFLNRLSRRVIVITSSLLCSWLAILATTPDRAAAQAQNRQYSAAEIQAGYRVYGSQCALCHGGNGDGIAGVNLARQQFRRASSDDDIRRTITMGVAGTPMPSFNLQPAELNGVIAYIRSGFDLTGTPFKVGSVARGQMVFEGKGGCASCHRVNGKGAFTAPDLSDIGVLRQPAAIQRSLTEPTKGMMPINRPLRVVTRDGRTIRGRRLNEDTFTVQLTDQDGRLMSLLKSDIREYELGTISAMPSFAGKLSDDELADLLAYLISLRGL